MLATHLKPKISIILPCQNEEDNIGQCLLTIRQILQDNNLAGEIIVSDSSTDRSAEIAEPLADRVVRHGKNGYGVAYLEGFDVARGDYLFLADADGTYDFNEIPRFINFLENDEYDLVIGNRFRGKIYRGAMPFLRRRFGNPVLTFIFRRLYQLPVGDIHCGMRAIKINSLKKLSLNAPGMEFASEMLIKAHQHQLRVKELPIDYFPRQGLSKLRAFPDGWRHLKLMFYHRFIR